MVRVLASVVALSILCGIQGAPAAKAAVKEATRSTSASAVTDDLITFEGAKNVVYQTAFYWVDLAKFYRDIVVAMLSKSMQGKYNQVVRDGNKYYSQAKDVYYAEVAPKIDPIIDAATTGATEVYSFVNEKQKALTAPSLKKMHAAYPATRGIAGPELTDRAVFIILSMALFRWAVRVLKALLLCVGFMFCSKRAKSVPSGESGSTEEAKAQHGKVDIMSTQISIIEAGTAGSTVIVRERQVPERSKFSVTGPTKEVGSSDYPGARCLMSAENLVK
ncbi:hypothetical protein Pmar_PMAR019539 [Perkinsus marinus ATCC 50983]|uniref:Uncharacterized protein n=1 Tax=Perkinsus marinus (strain ATCC 50983 / TXsc) TaxID=423536 RepID=C5KRA9_PERM5|nr:hypothetical protein Pmar_PMAR019539 [Perkinsus marinus ATCC 50983]EER13010.1 hypothetical protein Pmar_PMAR019539 [Perkinsus marinus ATCC 50983]|eukprot:XP_002781215.1 hypothetical protein Pmar_PMAR019539 [Perkinsus marinus ATCC 50983]